MMPQNPFKIFYNEATAQKYVKRAERSDLLVWQMDSAKGKKFVVVPPRQVFDYLRKAGPADNIGLYEWITPANAVYPVLGVDWYIFNDFEEWDNKAWAAIKRKLWLDKFKEAFALVYETEELPQRRGPPTWETMRVLSGCRRSNKEKPDAPRGQKSACFKISMHIVLRNNHYLVKGTEDTRHGQHSMNLVKQFVDAIIQKMKEFEGADMGIYSTKRAFRVMGAAKVTFADGLKQSATLKQLVLPGRTNRRKGTNVFHTVNRPAKIGTKEQEDLLYTKWCEHTASVEVGSHMHSFHKLVRETVATARW